ncbi:MAG: hypothetical protein ACJ72G_08825 [Friedmanniella sp.]
MPLLLFAYGEGMGMARVGRGLLTAALLCLLTAQGCSADLTGPSPSLSPTTPAQTPTESAQQRQERLDYAGAEKAYRTFRAEYGRVLRAGGAKEPTSVMKATAGGSYLREFAEIVMAYAGLADRQMGDEKVAYVRHVGYSGDELELEVCEDSRDVRIVGSRGHTVGRGEVRKAQMQVRNTGDGWKVWSGRGRKVQSCD